MAARATCFVARSVSSAILRRSSPSTIGSMSARAVSTTPVRYEYEDVIVKEKLWKLGKLNHVAIAVPDLEKATMMYRDVMGAEVSEPTALPDHGVYTVFVNLGNTKIELLHPLGENSPIEGFLKKKTDGGIHHICIEVENVHAAVKDLQKQKIRALNPEPKIGAHGKPVVFLHPKDCGGVLVEIEEA